MNAVYTAAVDAFLAGQINALTATIRAGLVTDDFAFDDTHHLISDVGVSVTHQVIVSIDHIAGGALYPDPITFTGVPAGPDHYTGLVFWVQGSGTLLCHIDTRADTIPLDIATDSGDLTFSFDRLFRL